MNDDVLGELGVHHLVSADHRNGSSWVPLAGGGLVAETSTSTAFHAALDGGAARPLQVRVVIAPAVSVPGAPDGYYGRSEAWYLAAS